MKKTLLLFLLLFPGVIHPVSSTLNSINRIDEPTIQQQDEEVEHNKPSIQRRYDEGGGLPSYTFNYGSFSYKNHNYNAKCETDNFIIYFDKTSEAMLSSIIGVGSCYEDVRVTYSQMGFAYPTYENNFNKLRIGILTSTSGNASATTYYDPWKNKNAWSNIVHYGFTNSLTDELKSDIAHEYLHAIQNTYNTDMGWFKEACADWGDLVIMGSDSKAFGRIHEFISQNSYLSDSNHQYEASIFPYTLSHEYGNGVIVKIFEGFGNLAWNNRNYTDSKFKNIVTNALTQYGSDNFDSMLNKMHSYFVSPHKWYSSFGLLASIWGTKPATRTTNITETLNSGTISGTINKLSGQYLKFNIPDEIKGDVSFSISFTKNACRSSKYYSRGDNFTPDIIVNNPIGTCSGTFEEVCEDNYNSIGLVLTNSETSSADYTLTYTFNLTHKQNDFYAQTRIIEERLYIPSGRYAEYKVKFEYSGYKIIQTAGSFDTKIAVYKNGSVINNVSACDDKGFSSNSWYSLNAQANVEYTIRITCYYSTLSGYTKLLIIPQRTESYLVPMQFTEIFTSTEPFYLNDTVTERALRLQVFKPSESRTYSISLESAFDNYLYVFDMSDNSLGVQGTDYDDDSAGNLNARITRYLDSSKTYLIIYGQFNPSRSLDNVSPTIYLDIE